MKGYEKFREHVTRLFIDLLESEDGDLRLDDEDLDGNRDPPKLPQPCPNNKKDLVKLMTKYLSDVAKWQGGFKTKRSVPWSKLGSLPRGTLLTTESVPSHVNLGQTNVVQGDAWVDWYQHILQRENNGHVPAICWTAEALKKPFERGATKTVFQSAGLGPDDDENDDWSRELDKLQPFSDGKNENLDVPMGDSSQTSVPTDQPVIDPHLQDPQASEQNENLDVPMGDSSQTFVPTDQPVIDPHLQDPQASEQCQHHQSTLGLDCVMGDESPGPLVPTTHPSDPEHVPLIPESRRSLMGRKDKPGWPAKSNASVARGSNRKKSEARKRDAQEARGEITSVVVGPSKRTRREPVEGSPALITNRVAVVNWSFTGLLWSLDLDAGGAKDVHDSVPSSLRGDFKNVMKKFLTIDNAVSSRYGLISDSSFRLPELEGSPPVVLRWVRHFNDHLPNLPPFPVDDSMLTADSIQSITQWLLALPLAALDTISDENLLDIPWFRPRGQGLAHVMWGFSLWARSFDSKIKRFDVPESFGLFVSRLHKLLSRLQVPKKRDQCSAVYHTFHTGSTISPVSLLSVVSV
ncbi:hypothetical protein VKT23_012826 [Stygiomarasmius scandens]|uniref:Uncharacterized protein n=1 Tax=Marasmiellus scandens TaxID=2682957 RepID=A0ABR1J4F0_9AGAR